MPNRYIIEMVLRASDKASGVVRASGKTNEKMAKRSATSFAQIAIAAAAVTFALQRLADGFIQVVSAGADQIEAINKAQVIFKNATGIITLFARKSADAFGISKTDALEYGSSLGIILQKSGETEHATAQMSVQLLKVASDLASIHNIPIADALNKLRAGLVGESEPLRRVGILLNAKAVALKAVELGVAATASEVSEAAKIHARYALIVEESAFAEGDFARTAEDLPNLMRRIQAEVQNLTANIGIDLIPAAKDMAKNFKAFISEHGPNIRKEFQTIIQSVRDFASYIAPTVEGVFGGLQKLAIFFRENTNPMRLAIIAIGLALLKSFGPQSIAVLSVVTILVTLNEFVNTMQTVSEESKKGGDNIRSWGRAVKEAGQDADIGFISAAYGDMVEQFGALIGQQDDYIGSVHAVSRAVSIAAREQEYYNEMVELSREVSGRQRTAYDETTIATNKMRIAQEKLAAVESLVDYHKKVADQRRVTAEMDKAIISSRLQKYHLEQLQKKESEGLVISDKVMTSYRLKKYHLV